eukprot:GHVS01010210.1.p1 GENE.GHVS01010210.1~~GHVS01010210.1.p1  ORF type:complete len:279 (+),score=22.75 GHVS01010210.1:23-838(+)
MATSVAVPALLLLLAFIFCASGAGRLPSVSSVSSIPPAVVQQGTSSQQKVSHHNEASSCNGRTAGETVAVGSRTGGRGGFSVPLFIRWLKKSFGPGESMTSGDVEELGVHPLRMQRWRIVLSRGWFRSRLHVEIDFFRDGTLLTSDGHPGYWRLDRYGVLWEALVCPVKYHRSADLEAAPNVAPRSQADEKGKSTKTSEEDILSTLVEGSLPMVLRFSAEVNWNAFGVRPRMCRGIATCDRVSRYLPQWLFRPVVASFHGYGIGVDTTMRP